MKRILLSLLSLVVCVLCMPEVSASRRNSFATPKTPKSYVKKAPCAGMGQKSSANGLYKTKRVSGHTKQTSKGYTYVNSYARSK